MFKVTIQYDEGHEKFDLKAVDFVDAASKAIRYVQTEQKLLDEQRTIESVKVERKVKNAN